MCIDITPIMTAAFIWGWVAAFMVAGLSLWAYNHLSEASRRDRQRAQKRAARRARLGLT